MTEFVFNRYDTIGANAAEDDHDYLSECFVDMGELPILQNVTDPRFLVVGRTGSGKTALFMQLAMRYNCYLLDANAKGFCYTEKTAVFEDLTVKGMNLAPYLKLLWMHVLIIEVIQETVPVDQKDSIIERLKSLFSPRRNVKEETALKYLEKYQGEFWTDTTEKTRRISEEFTQTLEKVIKGEIDAKVKLGEIISIDGDGLYDKRDSTSHTRETTYEVEKRGIEIVSHHLASQISTIPAVIDTLLQDNKKIVYIAIDKLDESVISDTFRYQSLRGLLDAIRDLNRSVANLKIVVSIRTDLLDCILKKVEIPGQQYEKYKSLFLQIKWDKQQLIDLAEKRVQKLVRKRYQPKSPVLLHELFPEKMHVPNGQTIAFADYVIERSWDRPRDIIDFINYCIEVAEGNNQVTQEMARQAERRYSRDRYSSLQEEWGKSIPEIRVLLDLLVGFEVGFNVASIDEEKTVDWVIEVLKTGDPSSDLYRLASEYDKKSATYAAFRNACLQALYTAGIVGIKFSPTDPMKWSYRENYSYEEDDIHDNSLIRIHPGLWAHYGISE